MNQVYDTCEEYNDENQSMIDELSFIIQYSQDERDRNSIQEEENQNKNLPMKSAISFKSYKDQNSQDDMDNSLDLEIK